LLDFRRFFEKIAFLIMQNIEIRLVGINVCLLQHW
jgi:hypothetical protein